jgi:predicted enzyme related to lactoylglutathione lyase
MAKAVGVGGIFLKAQDPKALSAWYAKHLGISTVEGGSMVFEGPESFGTSAFSYFPLDTKHFGEGPQAAMVNFRVDDLGQLLTDLAAAGVRVDPKVEDYGGFGKFGWIWDLEGNRVELWEPSGE